MFRVRERNVSQNVHLITIIIGAISFMFTILKFEFSILQVNRYIVRRTSNLRDLTVVEKIE